MIIKNVKGGAVTQLALRFLLSKSSDGFISLISWVSVIGVALGVIALIVVTSVLNGFEGELTRVITGMNGDIVLYSRGTPVRDSAFVREKIQKIAPEVQATSPSFVTELMVVGPHGAAGSVLDGFDPATLDQVTSISKRIVEGRFAQKGAEITLGYALAEKIGAKVGHQVKLISPFANPSESPNEKKSETPLVIPLDVVGIFKAGMYEYDSKFAFVPLSFVQEQLKEPDSVTTFKLKLPPDVDSFKVANALTASFGYPFKAKNWGQLNNNLFYAIELEKVVIAIILTAIVIVAAFNVVSTLMMMVHDKTQAISILKAMGLKPWECFRIFCLIGMLIGGVGTLVGLGLGLGVNELIKRGDWINLPADVYHIDFLPVIVHWKEIGWILFFAVFVCFLATLWPALQIAKKSPLSGLRYE